MKQILAAVGTRSELARLAPALRSIRDDDAGVMRPRLMHTGEKSQMVWSTGALFGLTLDRQHSLSEDTLTLADMSWQIANAVGHELDSRDTDLVVVQGSSMTAMLAGQQAFLRNIPVLHVDGFAPRLGVSTTSLAESNRRMLSALASFRCVPDRSQADELRRLGYPPYGVGVTGSSAVEAVQMVLSQRPSMRIEDTVNGSERAEGIFVDVKDEDSTRETNSELGFALATLAHDYPDLPIRVMCPMGRSNKCLLLSIIGALRNVEMVSPGDYFSYLKSLASSALVLTNAEDVAEEGLAMSRPVLLMLPGVQSASANTALDFGAIPAEQDSIVTAVEAALAAHSRFNGDGELGGDWRTKRAIGDGNASFRIVSLLNNWARNDVLTARAFEPYDGQLKSPRGIQPEVSAPHMQ